MYYKLVSYLHSIASCFIYANLYTVVWITIIITIKLTYIMSNNPIEYRTNFTV